MREEVFSRGKIAGRISKDFIPLAVRVPQVTRGNNDEFRFYDSLRNQKIPSTVPGGRSVPQGVAITSPAGLVYEWIQVFEEEADFLEFLERNMQEFNKQPITSGPRTLPGTHPASSCPVSRHGEPGGLAGRIYGRALEDGLPCKDTERQNRYMQEGTEIPAPLVQHLERRLRDGASIPGPIVESILAQVYMGQKDVALLNNPLRAPTNRKELDFKLFKEGKGLWRIEGSSGLEAGKAKHPGVPFFHRQDMKWEGFLMEKGGKVQEIGLLGEGDFELTWKGFTGDKDKYRSLMAGRQINEMSKVRFGITLKRK